MGEDRASLVRFGDDFFGNPDLEQHPESAQYLQLSLIIFKEIGNRDSEAKTLLRLALLHQKLSSIENALDYCNQALALATELGIPLVEECEKLRKELEGEG